MVAWMTSSAVFLHAVCPIERTKREREKQKQTDRNSVGACISVGVRVCVTRILSAFLPGWGLDFVFFFWIRCFPPTFSFLNLISKINRWMDRCS